MELNRDVAISLGGTWPLEIFDRTQFSRALLLMQFSARTRIAKTNMPLIQRSFYLLNVRYIFAIFLRN